MLYSRDMFDQLIHRWLRVPYSLHTVVKKNSKTGPTILFIHGIGNSGKVWDEVIAQLPDGVRTVTVDLLGFGKSPRPAWITYNAKTQARSVLATYLKLRLRGRVLVVGHSLGSLVAVELARRYPLLVRGLILCSPPFYHLEDGERQLLPKPEKVLRSIYKVLKNHPDEFLKVAGLALRYRLITEAFDVTKDSVGAYMATLEAAIINQTAMRDVQKLNLPIDILHGLFDPVVIGQNLVWLAKTRPNIKLHHIASGHDISGPMISATVKAVNNSLN